RARIFAPRSPLVNLILTLRPIVDQHASAYAKISDEPHGLDFSSGHDYVDGLGVGEGFDESIVRQLSPARVRFKTLESERNCGALNYAVAPVRAGGFLNVLRKPLAQLGLRLEAVRVFKQPRHGWIHHNGGC